MRFLDIIDKKRMNKELNENEIKFFIESYNKDLLQDYQVSALLMAIVINGMSEKETIYLCKAMINSGLTVDLSSINGIKVDKHSTGGVGDKTSLVLLPIVAACGCKVAKMSGRGLGHTGGTIDKLESIEGLNVVLSNEMFIKQVNEIGIAIISQNQNLVPADKKLYALRDVTATVESIPLIASSIMSKKIASGADVILLDVKYGDGAFMQSIKEARELATLMIKIGNYFNKTTKVVLSSMQQPLGYAIGNALEINEVLDTLCGKGPSDLMNLCTKQASLLLQMSMNIDEEEANKRITQVIHDKSAYNKFIEMIKAQNGNVNLILDKHLVTKRKHNVAINKSGYISKIYTKNLGLLAMKLKAGREFKDQNIDYGVGFILKAKVSDYLEKNDILIEVYDDNELSEEFIHDIINCYEISDQKCDAPILIEGII